MRLGLKIFAIMALLALAATIAGISIAAAFYDPTLRILGICGFIAAAIVTVLVLFSINHFIIKPLNMVAEAIKRLAKGDVKAPVPTGHDDEIGEMAKAIEAFQHQAVAANSLTTEITNDVGRIAVAAGQASNAVSQVSDGSNLQLNSLRKTAAASARARSPSPMSPKTPISPASRPPRPRLWPPTA